MAKITPSKISRWRLYDPISGKIVTTHPGPNPYPREVKESEARRAAALAITNFKQYDISRHEICHVRHVPTMDVYIIRWQMGRHGEVPTKVIAMLVATELKEE